MDTHLVWNVGWYSNEYRLYCLSRVHQLVNSVQILYHVYSDAQYCIVTDLNVQRRVIGAVLLNGQR